MATGNKVTGAPKTSIDQFRQAINTLEAKRKSKIFCFIEGEHHHICEPTLLQVYHCRNEFKGINTLEILIDSGGGHANIAYQITKFFRQNCKTLNVIVPFHAKSAATLMCLPADNIYLSEFSELGPIDVQVQDQLERGSRPFSPLDEFKSLEFLRDYAAGSLDYFTALLLARSGMSIKEALHESIPCITSMMRPMYEKIDPVKFGEHRRLLSEGEEYAKRLLRLAKHPHPDEIAAKLVERYPVHDFVIDFHEALHTLELPVKELDKGDFEILEALFSVQEQGYYGFVKQRKQYARKGRQPQKTIAVVPKSSTKSTA